MTVSVHERTEAHPRRRLDTPDDAATRGPARTGWIALVVAAVGLVLCFVVGRRLQADGFRLFTLLPPLTGRFDPRIPPTAILPVIVGVAVVGGGPALTRRVEWRALLGVAALAALAWSAALAAVDGTGGFVGPVLREGDYLAALPSIGAPGPFLERFVYTIARYPTHVRAHPPGLVVGLWWLDRIGLGGAGWVAALQHVAAASAVPAVLLAVREVASVRMARRVAPFLVLTPAAVAVGSGDAVFLGAGAWAVGALILATGRTGRPAVMWALAGGVLFGAGIFLTYGLVLLGLVPFVVAVSRRRPDVLAVAAVGIVLVTIAFAAAGFWWWDGLTATREQYALSVARSRPYAFYLVANLAAFAIALGPAVIAAVPRLRDRRLWLLVGGGLAAVLFADLSGLSKAEVERIWLPFVPWLAVATAIYRERETTAWLTAQGGWAVAVQLTVWSLW